MSEDAIFDELISDFYKIWFRYHPLAAIFAGVSGYEGRLAADGDDDMGALASLLSNLLVGLEELDYTALDADRQLDLSLLFGAAAIEHRTLIEQDWRHRDPARYLPLKTLQELVVRQPERFCEAMQGVLACSADYLRDARGILSELPELVSPLWLADAIETAESGAPWLKRLERELPQTRECCADQGKLQALGSEVAEALADFRDFLVKDLAPVAQGSSESGLELVSYLFKQRHQLVLSADKALNLARQERDRLSAELAEQGLDAKNIRERAAAQQKLSGSEREQAYQSESDRLKQFLLDKQLLKLPEQALELRVTEHCFTKCECGSYLRTETGGVFLIPGETQIIGGESLASIRLRTLYGGWAGRHYLCWSGGVQARSLVRQINPSSALKRGWGHYFSRVLEQHSYFGEEDLLQLHQRRIALAEQAVIDLEFHLGLLDSMDALARLRDLSDLPGWAESNLTAISRRPTDAFMAMFGATLIESTWRARKETEEGLQSFHSQLLAHGPVTLPLVVRRAFGDDCWEAVMQAAAPK